MVPLIVTRMSASFGIALLVTSEPMRAIRRTPGQVRAACTNNRTARSRSRRGSATDGLGLWDSLRGIWLDAGSAQSRSLPRKHGAMGNLIPSRNRPFDHAGGVFAQQVSLLHKLRRLVPHEPLVLSAATVSLFDRYARVMPLFSLGFGHRERNE